MYEAFYGFKEKPFSILPDPGFLYFSSVHSSAYAMLEYGVLNHAGFTVITGEIGCGKTTLIRHLLNQLGPDVRVGLISNAQQDFGELLQWVLMAFSLDYHARSKVELFDQFQKFMIDEYAQGRRVILIIDEAQNLDPRTLEELRMLSNINADKDQLLQLILVGQPNLRDLLGRPELIQFSQRISADYHLAPLTLNDTVQYVQHRLKMAGREKPLFTHSACELLHRAARGVPRVINILADFALVYGYADAAPLIDRRLVMAVIKDKVRAGSLQLSHLTHPVVQRAVGAVKRPEAVPNPEDPAAPRSGGSVVGFSKDPHRKFTKD
jgi:type II secretory pathway predicted ATPase ExeA